MRINKVKLSEWTHELVLEVDNLNEVGDFVNSFKAGEYDITIRKEKRSRNANSYAWLLLTKIAASQHISAIEAYQNAIRDIGGIYEQLYCRAAAVDAFKASFTAGHIGRFVDCISIDEGGWAELLLTYGSSDFNKSQMASFIDGIIQDCEALGIEHKPQADIDSMLEAYEW